ncbi:hypothetical protein CWI42_030710 [Ordospora colligata]|uniref:Uncharacterized protein n=1 Tax=Ordospora colligata OC4 TaxID=1354746 RepID=A0A0B2UG43_9MICR|nr:uncharacterized protein M896_030420 [Ordospora colligata OC4]KHN70056.1 hypothetical protein M896_030420 [Ordospora colligata OC4]TBU16438.1 hypothetical protein CWI41_030380 [Ordospora colligata]TBU16623.1 hypothetical protein CWI40_030780 [Ordospora colligata]TBU19196.1 hypothetical protein CWI42_030710 [Ordospora colligata]
MIGRSLSEVLDVKLFENRRICIDEVLPQNVDFFVVEMSDILKACIFAFNESSEHYKKIAVRYGWNVSVKSVYECSYVDSGILDDVWCALNVHECNASGWIDVYRSNTCKVTDWYKYDIVVRVEPLSSGVSTEIDGRVVVFDREREYMKVKYKVLGNKVVYYIE